ncbi:AraC family transcriptional regulator [Paenibacillaceae bacterium]|nr:AraC family transcriptional regulator [Paenibacillaceae bacterium]
MALEAGDQKLTSFFSSYQQNCLPFHQFVYCYQGSCTFHTDDTQIDILAGTALFMKPELVHHYKLQGEACGLTWVAFNGYLIQQLSADYGMATQEPYAVIHGQTLPALQREMTALFDYADDPFALQQLSTVLYRITIEFFIAWKRRAIAPRYDNTQDAIAAAATRWIRTNISEPANVSLLAEELRLSRQHLCRIFQQRFGISTKAYWTRLKIAQSQQQLAQYPHKTIKEIALELGFVNMSHFNKVFRQVTGSSPGTFRSSCMTRLLPET